MQTARLRYNGRSESCETDKTEKVMIQMKRLLSAWLILLLLMMCVPVHADHYYYGTMMVDNCNEWVSLREGPSTSRKRLAKVPLYDLVTDAEWWPECGDFIYCCYNGQYGYILMKYLERWEDPEPEGEAQYTSGLGFSFIYDASMMTVEPEQSEDGHSLLVEAKNTDDPVYLELLMTASVNMTPSEYLQHSLPAGTAYREDTTDSGASLRWFSKPYANNAGLTAVYYAVEDGPDGLVAVGTCPAAQADEWEETFTALMRTVRFVVPQPLRIDWAEATKAAVTVDDAGEYVTIMASENLYDVSFLSLDLTGFSSSGGLLFDTEVLFSRAMIGPDAPLVVRIEFPGDFPCYGIRVTDGAGRTRQFAIEMSGLDGSLLLEEF